MAAPSGKIDVCPVHRGPYADGPGRYNGWAITSYFGPRKDPLTGRAGNHGGQDLAHGLCFGWEILAPIGGLLSQAWDQSGGGNWSTIKGDNGDRWSFGHASRYADPLWPGGGSRWVDPGDVVALVGSSGKSTGAHIHVAYMRAGQSFYSDPFDPLATYQQTAQPAAEATAAVAKSITPESEEDDMQLRWQENTKELYLVTGGVKIYIPFTSKGGVSGDDMKAAAIAAGAVDRTNEPGAAFLEIFPTVRP